MSLSYIGQQITFYTGLFFLATGIVGNGINILLFTSVRLYRTTPCTFYFLIVSICNIADILIYIPSRIETIVYGIDLTRTSTSWCKMRQFIGVSFILTSLSCSCLATIDQFFAISQSVNLRRFSNIKWAHRIILIIIIVWVLHGIPVLLFYNISSITNSCVNTNSAYAIYYSVYVVGLLCAIPVLVMIVFGYLAYRNIQLTRVLAQQQANRQLMQMVLVEIILVLISFVPVGINNTYNLITSNISKDTNRLINENFASTLLSTMAYIYFAGSCYTFLITSSRFRRAFKDRILFCLRSNQIIPNQVRTDGPTNIIDKRIRNLTSTL